MCQQPPWGRLTAINVNSGEIAWQSALGVSDNLPAGDSAHGAAERRRLDRDGRRPRLHRRDRRHALPRVRRQTGRELWTAKLDASAHATPITYRGQERQAVVVVTATGGSFLDSPVTGDSIVAFALP